MSKPEESSYKRIIKNSIYIGGSSSINILAGFFRTKIVALLLGPSGVGLASLFNAFITIGNSIFSAGIGLVGTRKIAEAYSHKKMQEVGEYRVVLILSAAFLSVFAALALFFLRGPLLTLVFSNKTNEYTVVILGLGISFSIVQTIQSSILQGFFKIKEIAQQTLFSAIVYSLIGCLILFRFKESGLVAYTVVGPLISVIISFYFMHRLPEINVGRNYLTVFASHWKPLFSQGIVFMMAGIVQSLAHFLIRIIINDQLGLTSVGYFQSAFVISVTYLNFILGAMSADYYPNLSGVISDKEKASKLVNDQTVISLLLAGPVILLMISLSPLFISILYSSDFYPATSILRWQIFSDFFKILSWPLGYIILAHGNSKMFFVTETIGLGVLVVCIFLLLPYFGLEITGAAYLISYLVYLPMVYLLSKKSIHFSWNKNVLFLIKVFGGTSLLVFALSFFIKIPILLGLILSGFFGLFSFSAIFKLMSVKGAFLNKWAERIGNFYNRIGLRLG